MQGIQFGTTTRLTMRSGSSRSFYSPHAFEQMASENKKFGELIDLEVKRVQAGRTDHPVEVYWVGDGLALMVDGPSVEQLHREIWNTAKAMAEGADKQHHSDASGFNWFSVAPLTDAAKREVLKHYARTAEHRVDVTV